jgi:diguanylate cyclase (GGDEF)-like protein/PAS domain S-box-containing protein
MRIKELPLALVRPMLAMLPPLVALGIQLALWRFIQPYVWFLFYAAVFISSWIGGRTAGLWATAISVVMVWWFFIPPERSFAIEHYGYLFPVLVFVAMGVLFSLFHGRLREINRKALVSLAAVQSAHDEINRLYEEAKQARDAIAEREERLKIFAALIENSSDFIGIADPNGKPIYVNPAGRRMVGLGPDQPVGDTQIPEYYPPELRDFVSDVIVKSMVEEGQWSGETYFRHWQTQEPIPVSDEHFMIRDPETGRVLGMGTVTRDVSEIRRAQAALRSSEERLNQAQRIAHIGSWELNLRNNVLVWSEECYRIFEIDPSRFGASYEAFLDLVHPDDRAAVEAAYANSVKTGMPYAIEHRLLFPDGRIKYVREQGETFYEKDTPVRSIGTVQDITERRHADEALRASEARFRELVELAPDGIFIADLDGRYTDVNGAGCRMLGYAREEIVGKTIIDLIPPEDIGRLEQSKGQMLQGASHVAEWTLRRKDGTHLPVEVSANILPDGRWQGFVRDISERKRAEERLRQAAAVFSSTMEGIVITDADVNIVAVNRAYTSITGFIPEEVLGKNPRVHQSGRHDEAFYQALWQSLEQTGQWQGEIWNRRKSGELFPAWENISAVKDGQGRITNYISVMSDISSIKQAEERLTYLAHHDALTGLPNRLAFAANLEQALERAKRHQRKVALLFLDLDRFKVINDTLGHAVGDQLLQVVGERLKSSLRAQDVAARLGGDEFTVVLEDIDHPEDAALLAQKLIRAVAEPSRLEGHEVVTSTSVGIGIYPDDAGTASDLVKAADTAMYRAKGHGRNTYEFYTSELTTQALHHFAIETDLRRALARDELTLFYQPQIELPTGRTRGVEALLRWRHPERGLVLPEEFIGIAEESGLIDAIGDWVLKQACAQARRWRDTGLPAVRISINLSGHQLLYDHTVETMRQALEDNCFKAGDVLCELEITESVFQSGERSLDALRQLRSLGVRIAIDDFGTGYSSLSHLKHLPIDTLKIDRAFLRNVPDDADNKAIAAAIISMGHSLGLKVIAEGVETKAQLDFLKQEGCDEAQGFLIGKPVAPERIGPFLEASRQVALSTDAASEGLGRGQKVKAGP